jgi:TonB family protein
MSNRKNDIERYLRGEMTAAEMHALEKEALRDPFLAEALEGIDHAGHDKFLFDLSELHKSVRQRTKARRGKIISITRWSYGIAAGLVLLAASSVYIISLIQSKQSVKSSMQESIAEKDSPSYADSITTSDTTGIQGYLSYAEKDSQQSSPSHVQSRPGVSTEQSGDPDALTLAEVAEEQAETRELQRIVTAELTEYPPVADSVPTSEKIASGLASPTRQETISGRAQGLIASNTVRGKVTSAEDGLPLPGVNVVIKGTSTGAVTNANGEYELIVNNPNQSLVFSFIGLRSVESKIADQKEINVKMPQDQGQLSEVVVTASGPVGDDNTSDSKLLQFAEPAGGRQLFRRYLEEKMIYPEDAKKNKIEGRVTVQFNVDENGDLSDFKVLRGIGHGCDEELIRLIRQGPRWSPSKKGDQPFTDKVRVRLRFSLAR